MTYLMTSLFAAVPTLIVMLLTYYSSESHEYVSARTADKRGPLRVVRDHPELLGRLTGCGLSWLLYDFVYYGSSFNQVSSSLESALFMVARLGRLARFSSLMVSDGR